jgi:hypothetical protein
MLEDLGGAVRNTKLTSELLKGVSCDSCGRRTKQIRIEIRGGIE